jgi:hypothetical protein
MRFKGSLATVLTTFLLAMSPWGSACDLSCSLQTLRSLGCQSAGSYADHQETETMPAGMDMSQQSHAGLAEAHSDSQSGTVLLNDTSCMHEKCSQASVSVSAVRSDHGQFKRADVTAVSAIRPHVNLLLPSCIRSETSPPNIAAISPISIHLRI